MIDILKKNLSSLGYDIANVLSYEINIYDEFADEETTIDKLQHSVRGHHVWVVADVNGKKTVINKKTLQPMLVKYNDRLVQALELCNAAQIHG